MSTILPQRLTGYIKWFNNKKGFGFITVCSEGEYFENDIFIHFTALRSKNEPCTYLVQGEYVEFNLCKLINNNHTFQASDVTGFNGGHMLYQYKPQKPNAEMRVEKSK